MSGYDLTKEAPLAAHQLDGFRRAQQLAYACAEAVAPTLDEGVTEVEATERMLTWMGDHGVRDYFHRPFAWFGDRTAFAGFRVPLQFFPTGRRLTSGMAFILDVAPVVDGFTADIGYSGALGTNPMQELVMAGLEAHRTLVVDAINDGRTLRQVYDDVDRLIARQGFTNRHRAYPFGVIAHRVGTVGDGPAPSIAHFGLRSLRGLARDVRVGRRGGWSPLWGPTRLSDHAATPGLWAVEPHLGFRGVGAKFEELLVVDHDGTARWLDDDLPHVRAWADRRAGSTASSTAAGTATPTATPATPDGTDREEAA